jgi:D-alanine-D-alanine ligase
MKLVCPDLGVDTPRYIFARGRAEAELAAAHFLFPLLVKHPNSYGSVGLTKDSRVKTPDQLFAQVERMADEFGAALVEEFVEGREFTVLVAEPGEGETSPRAYPPIEVCFPPGESFKHFGLKWESWAALGWRPVADASLAARLTNAARQIFVGMGGVGYARCDFRVDRDGRPFLLDVNPNPGVFYPPGQYGAADHILSHHPGGQREFLEHIIACALRRREQRRPKRKVEYH